MRLQIPTKLLFLFLSFTFTNTLFAQTRSLVPAFGGSGAAKGGAISSVLNHDGSINHGVAGSFDPKGFRMITGKDGTPRFVSDDAQDTLSTTADCNDGWDARFWTNGVTGIPRIGPLIPDPPQVRAVVIDSSGNLYVAGQFTTAGNMRVSSIAKWDGLNWSALSSGLITQPYPEVTWPGNVYAMTASGTDVYVAGEFTLAGGVAVNNVAKWDGSSWSALGSGTSGPVSAIAVSGTDVYVGGITSADGMPVHGIAKWNGSSWTALGSGVDGSVYAITSAGTDVYVGGNFTAAGGVPASNIAKWDGSAWLPLGTGVGIGSIGAIAVSGPNVYVGGHFSSAGGIPVNNIAKWDGSAWSSLGSGVSDPIQIANVYVSAIAMSGTDIYAGGVFQTAGGILATNVAKWNGTSWSALASGTNTSVYDIAVSGSNVYVGGVFDGAGGVNANGIAKWNGANWSTIELDGGGAGIYGTVSEIAISDSDVYVGGNFRQAGGTLANNIAKWNGSSWSPLGSGVDGPVYAIAVSGKDVYVGGNFTSAGGVAANSIAKWNGSSWSPLGSGVDLYVYGIAVAGNDVYVGGYFTTAGGVGAKSIAKWDGSTWSAMGSGVSSPYSRTYVYDIELLGNDVYVAGDFTIAGGVPGTQAIAKWNGSSWSALGSGVAGPPYCLPRGNWCLVAGVWDIELSGPDLYAAGYFNTAGDIAANNIALWNGYGWSGLGTGVLPPGLGSLGYASTIALWGSDLYVGGVFETAGGIPANNIAKWNGSSWSALGSGVDRGVGAIAISNSSVFVGGSFATAGCNAASNFSRYSLAGKVTLSGQIMTQDARGLRDAAVIITNPVDGTRRTVRTNTFGYYFFDGLDVGAQYSLSVLSKRYRFASREVTPMSDLSGIDFVGVE